jgi:hypothetical protein
MTNMTFCSLITEFVVTKFRVTFDDFLRKKHFSGIWDSSEDLIQLIISKSTMYNFNYSKLVQIIEIMILFDNFFMVNSSQQ